MTDYEQLVIDWAFLAPLEETIKGSETKGLRARWEFGCYLRDEVPRGVGGRGNVGPLRAIAAELNVSEQELRYRRQFAIRYPTEEKLANALASFESWFDIISRGLGKERPQISEPEPLPEGVFEVIYADPPWLYEQPGGRTPQLRAVELHYPTMSDEEIAAIEVPAADDSVCFLWATNPKLREALDVLGAWGFDYRTNLAWVKDKIGMGYYVRGQHELLLIGRRGDLPVPHEANRPASVIHAPRAQHSAKPDAAYEAIERMYPDARKLELFAREMRPGWASWGAVAA